MSVPKKLIRLQKELLSARELALKKKMKRASKRNARAIYTKPVRNTIDPKKAFPMFFPMTEMEKYLPKEHIK